MIIPLELMRIIIEKALLREGEILPRPRFTTLLLEPNAGEN